MVDLENLVLAQDHLVVMGDQVVDLMDIVQQEPQEDQVIHLL